MCQGSALFVKPVKSPRSVVRVRLGSWEVLFQIGKLGTSDREVRLVGLPEKRASKPDRKPSSSVSEIRPTPSFSNISSHFCLDHERWTKPWSQAKERHRKTEVKFQSSVGEKRTENEITSDFVACLSRLKKGHFSELFWPPIVSIPDHKRDSERQKRTGSDTFPNVRFFVGFLSAFCTRTDLETRLLAFFYRVQKFEKIPSKERTKRQIRSQKAHDKHTGNADPICVIVLFC